MNNIPIAMTGFSSLYFLKSMFGNNAKDIICSSTVFIVSIQLVAIELISRDIKINRCKCNDISNENTSEDNTFVTDDPNNNNEISGLNIKMPKNKKMSEATLSMYV